MRHGFRSSLARLVVASSIAWCCAGLYGCDNSNHATMSAPPSGGSSTMVLGGAEVARADASLQDDLRLVASVRVFFDHHSVGGNILEGLKVLAGAPSRASVRILPIDEAARVDGPVFADDDGGQNGFPKSKVDAFGASLRSVGGLRPDIAFMKFCYVDFNLHTDVDDVFASYSHAMTALEREHPQIVFAHVTVPLQVRPMSLKDRANRLLGREIWGDAANVKHEQFNQRLKQAFAPETIFDLARIESTGPGGRSNEFTYRGQTFQALDPAYTTDGGHLNLLGQKLAATEIVHFIATLARSKRLLSNEVR